MSVISDNDSGKVVEGCGGRLIQKTESLMKRRSQKYSNRASAAMSNSTSVTQLDRAPNIMPQKTYIFWLLILIIFFMAAVNFTVLIIMINVLRIGEGMESMEMLSKEEIIKLYGDTDFDYIVYNEEALKGFQDIPLQVRSNEGFVVMALNNYKDMISSDKMKLTNDEISFSNIDHFQVVDPVTQKTVFSTHNNNYEIPKGVSNLDIKRLRVNRLVSPSNSNLTIKSDSLTKIKGNEGMNVKGKEVTFFADGDIHLKSVKGDIHLLAGNITINMKDIQTSFTNQRGYASQYSGSHFKLCVCMPQGVLFKVPVLKGKNPQKACSNVDFSERNNPCVKL
ncbi:beta-sarcoglycan [Planococcus citri]|uniref:beta-sarcoglycan n=1 Tax=Planococcus citri TaxID=170843 RepID=UPI0031F9AD02